MELELFHKDDGYLLSWSNGWDGMRHAFGYNRASVAVEFKKIFRKEPASYGNDYAYSVFKLSIWPHKEEEDE